MTKLDKLLKVYRRGKKISCITAYDASISKYLEASEIDIVLVGDSLGQVIKGEKTTHNVTIDEVSYRASCVKSGLKNSILMTTFRKTPMIQSQAFKNSLKLLSLDLADLIKIEVSNNNLDIVRYLIKKVPLCAHI